LYVEEFGQHFDGVRIPSRPLSRRKNLKLAMGYPAQICYGRFCKSRIIPRARRSLLIKNCFEVVLKGGKEMSIEVALVIVGVMILVGAIVGGGIIYSGLEKVANAINKQK